jgi:hypothetical protein
MALPFDFGNARRRLRNNMGKVDIKEELAVQATAAENAEQDGNIRLDRRETTIQRHIGDKL